MKAPPGLRLVIDNALSPLVAKELRDRGYDAVHVKDLDMEAAEDEAIFAYAEREDRVIVSADTDFGTHWRPERKRNPLSSSCDTTRLQYQLAK